MICPDCGNEMRIHYTGDEYNPPGEWLYYYYWMCHSCWYSEEIQ